MRNRVIMNLVKIVIAFILCGIVIGYGDEKTTLIAVVLTLTVVFSLLYLEFGGSEDDNKS